MTTRKVAVVGGECTGKTVLCQTLAAELPGLWVPEYLREFVDRLGRAPRAEEQQGILAMQAEREAVAIEAAHRGDIDWVACDSAPIATAIYSEMYFADRSLYAPAARHHATYALTLLTDTDLPWEADGLQRDGPAVRAEFQTRVEAWLRASSAPFVLIGGIGRARVSAALNALHALESGSR
jgi:nicotinamide riboside kinase